ncbi:MAG TPA: stage III sporulation protein SpoIIIAB [Bacillota bacterium]|nr:stage III sporulation protein SpoIIIAB [Bacillota bacterium]
MKWIGALLFISVTTWFGFYYSKQLYNRPKHIRYLKSTLQILEAEMMYSKLPLDEVFRILAKQAPPPIESIFMDLYTRMQNNQNHVDFYTMWAEEMNKVTEKTALGRNEYEILLQFGKTLGQHDLAQQQKNILLTQTHLQRELEMAQEQAGTYGKMAKSLGVLCGIFVVLLLI